MEIFNRNEVYGVTFGNKHSYDDWGIYLADNTKDLPAPRRVTVDVPFRNGILDVTSALSNRIFYENRQLSFDFIVADNDRPWPVLLSEITGDIHGQSLDVITDMDPDWYWHAYNCTLEPPDRNDDLYMLTITCDCYPYKMEVNPTEYKISVDSSGRTIMCPNNRMEVSPTIHTTADVRLTYTNEYGTSKTVTLDTGNNVVDDLLFFQGYNRLDFARVNSNATVTITYRQGAL